MKQMRRSIGRTLLTAGLVYGCQLAFGVVVGACVSGEDDTTTTGRRITLTTSAELASGTSFESSMGWQIELRHVIVSSGPLYYFEGSPIELEARRAPAERDTRLGLLGWLVPAQAHAHPGHYDPGEARGEMLESSSFDLVPGPVALADGEGITGLVRSARFVWEAPPVGPLAEELGSDVVVVEGTATKGELVRVFRLTADRTDVLDAEGNPYLEGCAFEEVDMQADGAVTVHVDPRVWLDQAEFDDVPESADGEPVLVSADSRARLAFVRGLQKSNAITFSYSTESP